MIESVDNDGKNKSKSSGSSSTPVLDNFSRDLIKLAEEGKIGLDDLLEKHLSKEVISSIPNGKIITLLHVDNENCGTMIRDDKGYDNRILTANFMFLKGTFEDLKSSPVNMMRIKYLTDTEDYIFKKQFQSELDNLIYEPETYFINYLHCIE